MISRMISRSMLGILIVWLVSVLTCQTAQAQRPELTLRQFHHTAWTAADGAPADIWSMDQGPDGFLWLGTGVGLYRFDGIRFERFQPAPGERLASFDITSVKVIAADDIWVGYSDGGVSRLYRGRVTTFTEQDGLWPGMIVRLVRGKDGVLWAATHGGLARFEDGQWEKLGADWGLRDDLNVDLFQARNGTMWLSTANSIFFLRTGASKFEPTGARTVHATLTQMPDGRIWVTDALHGLRPLPDYEGGKLEGSWELKAASPGNILSVASYAVDALGVIWGTDRLNGGLFRFDPLAKMDAPHSILPSDIKDVFRRSDGLTADRSLPILKDREGNIWVGTNAGLNRFRLADIVPDAVVPRTTAYGYSVAAAADATYVTDGTWLYRARHGEASRRIAPLPAPGRMVPLQAQDGSLWYGASSGLYHFVDNRFSSLPLPDGADEAPVRAIAQDGSGALWIAFERGGVHRLKDGVWTVRSEFEGLPDPLVAQSDPAGAVWFGYPDGRLSRHDRTGMRVFSSRDGLEIGNVESFHFSEGYLWVGGEFGVARLDRDRFVTIGADRLSTLSGVSGIGTAENGSLLFNGLLGIVRMEMSEASKAVADPLYQPAYELLDRANGLPGVAQQGWGAPTIVTGADGRTWFVTNTGVATFNAFGDLRNALAPPLTILSVVADGAAYPVSEPLTLPKGASSIAIAYTAASLTIPERVHFRYRLENLDADWFDAGDRREAVFSNLGPGSYRFHVVAANEDGVWNTDGATLDFEIPPTFIQSWQFKLLGAVALVALLWLLYQLRMRAVANRIRMGMAERFGERERIARELHDTLLQSVQTLTLRFQFAVEELPQMATARPALEAAIDRADEVIAEGRDRVLDLRSIQTRGIEDIVSDIVKRQAFSPSVEITIASTGEPREFEPLVLDEIVRIASEAIYNIWRHAQAKRVSIGISHGARFILRLADDGVGIEAAVLERFERDGHFGLKGMRERAIRLRAELSVRNLPDVGAEVLLTVPGSIAYRTNKRRMFGSLRSPM